MNRWLGFLLALVILLALHEGLHAATALILGELEGVRVLSLRLNGVSIPLGVEVIYRTPVEERSGVQWALISGVSNLVTVGLGLGLLLVGERANRSLTGLAKVGVYYLTFLGLLADPFNLSIGPFLYGGDAEGIAVGLGDSRYLIQGFFLIVLFVNRELVAQKLLPTYHVQTTSFLLRPWFRLSRASRAGG